MHWVIATPGRTGSNLIAHHLVEMGYEKHEVNTSEENLNLLARSTECNLVTHDHGIFSLKPHGEASLCVSLRHNVFRQTCSGLISVKTNEFNADQYDGVPLRLKFSTSEFDIMMSKLTTVGLFQASQIDQTKWKNSFIIFYEDLLDMGIIEFCKKYEMPYKDDSYWTDRLSPRRPEDTIINYNELLEHYTKNQRHKAEKYLLDVMNVRKNS